MNSNQRLCSAIAAILSVHATAAGAATPTDAVGWNRSRVSRSAKSSSRRNAATKRAKRSGVTIQALTGETIAQLNIATLEDFVKLLPNVTTAATARAEQIYMRGLAATGSQS